MHPVDAAGELEKGDRVDVRFREHSGGADEEPGDQVTKANYVVTKCFPEGPGGIHVKEPNDPDYHRRLWYRLHTVPGGTVTGGVPYSSRERRKGVRAELRRSEGGA